MTALEEIKKALEGVTRWHETIDGMKSGNPLFDEQQQWVKYEDFLSETEILHREVKRLRNKVAARALTDEQLSDEISAIDEACKGGFGEGGGSPGEWWYERADELEHERKRRELEAKLQKHNSRTALASTGGEHNAE